MTQQISRWLGRAAVLALVLGAGLGGSTARAQFGLSINTPGASVGIGTGAYYPAPVVAAPVVAAPVVVAPPPVVYAPRPYYGGYGPRPFYGPGYPPRPYGYNYYGGGHHGPYPGPHYGPYGTPYRRF